MTPTPKEKSEALPSNEVLAIEMQEVQFKAEQRLPTQDAAPSATYKRFQITYYPAYAVVTLRSRYSAVREPEEWWYPMGDVRHMRPITKATRDAIKARDTQLAADRVASQTPVNDQPSA